MFTSEKELIEVLLMIENGINQPQTVRFNIAIFVRKIETIIALNDIIKGLEEQNKLLMSLKAKLLSIKSEVYDKDGIRRIISEIKTTN